MFPGQRPSQRPFQRRLPVAAGAGRGNSRHSDSSYETTSADRMHS